MVAQADDIFQKLPDLSQDQLQEVLSRASFLLHPTDTASDDAVDEIAPAFIQVLAKVGTKAPPLAVMLKHKQVGPALCKGAREIKRYVNDGFHPKSKVERLKCYQMVIELTVREMASFRFNIGPLTLAQQLVNVASVVENSFPGYYESGLLPMLVNKHKIA